MWALTAFLILVVDATPPNDYLLVPGGWAHKSCVHEVVGTGTLSQSSLPLCAHPFLRTRGTIKKNETHGAAWKAWMQHSVTSQTSSVTSLNSTWVVPEAPQSNGGQVLFWWNGVEPVDTSAVLQPVIQWGPSAAGGGDYWAYASWYVSSSHGSHYSKLVKLETGDSVLGTNTRLSNNAWVISASTKGKASSVLNFDPVPGAWGTAYHVLEAYGVTSDCSLYPQAGSVNFTKISLEVDGSSVAPITWTPLTQTAGCGERAIADDAGQDVSILFNTQ